MTKKALDGQNPRSEAMKDPSMVDLDRRQLLTRAILGSVAAAAGVAALPSEAEANDPHTLTFDVACDCRTGSPAFFAGEPRGEAFIINGKIFPAGTLPSGTANNDPTQPVNGVSPIGNWCCRGQVAGAFPSDIAPAYSSTPFAWNTQYFILTGGDALTVEGYTTPTGEDLSVTGGIRGFSGASGFVVEAPIGTNATGCPNFRARFRLRSGRGRD
jgi:hypothetical protein